MQILQNDTEAFYYVQDIDSDEQQFLFNKMLNYLKEVFQFRP